MNASAVLEPQRPFVQVSEEEVRVGIRYINEKDGVYLNGNILRNICNNAGEMMMRQVKVPDAVRQAAEKLLTQRDACEQRMFNRYRGAACKILSERSKKKRVASKARKLKLPAQDVNGQLLLAL